MSLGDGRPRWLAWLTMVVHLGSVTISSYASNAQEFCEGESYNAQCSRDEVVVLQTAQYGRMQLGRCVQMNMGYIGCAADVLGLADGKCSGRRSCTLNVPDTDFERTRPCFELKSYLQVSHTCLRVATARPSVCQMHKYVKLTAPSAYLSSQVTQQSGCGTALCPWVIEVPQGQRINVTLLDFAWGSQSTDYSSMQLCQKYAVVREMSDTKTVTICGNMHRESFQYLSKSNQLEIYLTPKSSANAEQFLLKYQAIGCPDLVPAPGALFVRKTDTDGAVRCRYSDEEWTLTCQGTIWVGTAGNCSQYAPRKSGHFLIGSMPMPHGIAVAIVAGVAIVIGMLILTVGLVIFKRHLRQKDEDARARATYSPPPCAEYASREDCMSPHYLPATKFVGPMPMEAQAKTDLPKTCGGRNDYTHIWERPLPVPHEPIIIE